MNVEDKTQFLSLHMQIKHSDKKQTSCASQTVCFSFIQSGPFILYRSISQMVYFYFPLFLFLFLPPNLHQWFSVFNSHFKQRTNLHSLHSHLDNILIILRLQECSNEVELALTLETKTTDHLLKTRACGTVNETSTSEALSVLYLFQRRCGPVQH